MESERIIIPTDTADSVNHSKKNNKRVCAVGTTVMRAMESSVSTTGTLKPTDSWTNKFIFQPYDFKVANAMITNFHLPKSSLLMMIASFM